MSDVASLSPVTARKAAVVPSGHSPAQLGAALWADGGSRVHAVIDGRIIPGLAARLEAAECLGWDCLQRGALSVQAEAQAACIVQMARSARFTHWLLHQAAADFGAWGVLMVSVEPLLIMREHSRRLMNVCGPDGRCRTWRWFDPELLETLLPDLSPEQASQFFLPGQALVLVGRQRWVWWRHVNGAVTREARERMPEPQGRAS